MALKIRLARGGSKKCPFYKVVVADVRAPRDGKFIEKIGTYNPLLAKDDENRFKVDAEKVKDWISKGAKPSDTVSRFLTAKGVIALSKAEEQKLANRIKQTQERIAAQKKAEEPEAVEEAPAAESAEEPAAEAAS